MEKWFDGCVVIDFDPDIGPKIVSCWPKHGLFLHGYDVTTLKFSAFPDSNPTLSDGETFVFKLIYQNPLASVITSTNNTPLNTSTSTSTTMSMTSSKSTSQLFPSEKLHYSTSCHKTPSKGSLEVAFSDKDMWNYCTFKQVIDATSKRGCHQRSFVLCSKRPYSTLLNHLSKILADHCLILDISALALSNKTELALDAAQDTNTSKSSENVGQDQLDIIFEVTSKTISSWPDPFPGKVLELPFFGNLLHAFVIHNRFDRDMNDEVKSVPTDISSADLNSSSNENPNQKGSHQALLNDRIVYLPSTVSEELIAQRQDSRICDFYGRPDLTWILLCSMPPSKLWNCWELMVLNEPFMVHGSNVSCETISSSVLSLIELISPIVFGGRGRPFMTIQDEEFEFMKNKCKSYSSIYPRHSHSHNIGTSVGSITAINTSHTNPNQNMMNMGTSSATYYRKEYVIGVSNPYFLRELEPWPNVLKLSLTRSSLNMVLDSKRASHSSSSSKTSPNTAHGMQQIQTSQPSTTSGSVIELSDQVEQSRPISEDISPLQIQSSSLHSSFHPPYYSLPCSSTATSSNSSSGHSSPIPLLSSQTLNANSARNVNATNEIKTSHDTTSDYHSPGHSRSSSLRRILTMTHLSAASSNQESTSSASSAPLPGNASSSTSPSTNLPSSSSNYMNMANMLSSPTLFSSLFLESSQSDKTFCSYRSRMICKDEKIVNCIEKFRLNHLNSTRSISQQQLEQEHTRRECLMTIWRHFEELSERFLAPFVSYCSTYLLQPTIQRLDKECKLEFPKKEIIREEFDRVSFIQFLVERGTPLKFRKRYRVTSNTTGTFHLSSSATHLASSGTSLTAASTHHSYSSQSWVSFYVHFLNSANFEIWWKHQRARCQERLNVSFRNELSQFDIQAWTSMSSTMTQKEEQLQYHRHEVDLVQALFTYQDELKTAIQDGASHSDIIITFERNIKYLKSLISGSDSFGKEAEVGC